MKLKTLLIVVGLLAAVSIVVYLVTRGGSDGPTDPRVGQPLLRAEVVQKAAQLRLSDDGSTVELAKDAGGSWRVTSFHDLPVDFDKLSRLVNQMTEAEIQRLVTRNPKLVERLDLGDASLDLLDDTGAVLWAIDLGRRADGSGRFVRYRDEQQAYLADFSGLLDVNAQSWADSSLVQLEPDRVAKIELEFLLGEGEPVIASRDSKDDPFTVANAPEGQRLRQGTVDTLLSALTNLHYSDVTQPDDPEVEAAREHRRTVTLTTFDGESVAIGIGRRPAEPAADTKDEAAEAGDEPAETASGDPAADAPQPGPIVAFVSGPRELAPLSGATDKLAFQIANYTFSRVPATRAELFEPVSEETPAP